MKIGDFPLVEALITTRNHLLGQRDEGRVLVMIDGRQQDAELAERVRPAINVELDRRLSDVDEQLEQLGVNLG
jgi:hypothetical protein